MIVHSKMSDSRYIPINSLEAGYLCRLGQKVHCGNGTGSALQGLERRFGYLIKPIELLNCIIRLKSDSLKF